MVDGSWLIVNGSWLMFEWHPRESIALVPTGSQPGGWEPIFGGSVSLQRIEKRRNLLEYIPSPEALNEAINH
jgi:hypothetical protein